MNVRFSILGVIILLLASCAPSFDQDAYKQATTLKADSLALIKKSTGSISSHRKSVSDLERDMRRAYEYNKGRKNNDLTVKQYEIILNSNGHSTQGYLEQWKLKKKLSRVRADNFYIIAGEQWDKIITYENEKRSITDQN